MKRLSVGHLEDTGYTMMYGDANKNKEFKYIDEIDGKKVKGRGYISNAGEVAREFFAPLVPLDEGFSFKEAFMKISPTKDSPIIMDSKEQDSTVPEKAENSVAPDYYSISEAKSELDKTYDQVKKLVTIIEKSDYRIFEREGGKLVFSSGDLHILELIFDSMDKNNLTYKEAVQTYFQPISETAIGSR